jgi:hypothetical protein
MPPVLGAIWAAGTGWYVHYQLTGRSHRVAHAMSMVMGTRTNAEFLKRHELIRQVFPTVKSVADLPLDSFDKSVLKNSYERFTEASSNLRKAQATGKDVLAAQDEKSNALAQLKLAKAIDAVQYTLNYYEFMAAGIHFGELDERLFYQTISPAVIGLCDRAEPYLKWVNAPNDGGEQLAFEYLKPLVKKWRQMTAADEANLALQAAEARRSASSSSP